MTYTPAELAAMKPRELDAVAAEVVCGWKNIRYVDSIWLLELARLVGVVPGEEEISGFATLQNEVPRFSLDLNAAHSFVPLAMPLDHPIWYSFATTTEWEGGKLKHYATFTGWDAAKGVSPEIEVEHDNLATAITICCILAKQQTLTEK